MPAHAIASSLSSPLSWPGQGRFPEFLEVDPRVAGGRVQGLVAQQIGDDLDVQAPAMESRGKGMPEEVNSVVVQPTTIEGHSHR
jgi:hypothetical protein